MKEKVTRLEEYIWFSQRHGIIDEVSEEGGIIRFRVKIWDEGRDAFITQWFNDRVPAYDFLDRVKAENESHHNIRLGGND